MIGCVGALALNELATEDPVHENPDVIQERPEDVRYVLEDVRAFDLARVDHLGEVDYDVLELVEIEVRDRV